MYMTELCRRRWREEGNVRNGRREMGLSPLYAGQARKIVSAGRSLRSIGYDPKI
jgi:hypothetical protein